MIWTLGYIFWMVINVGIAIPTNTTEVDVFDSFSARALPCTQSAPICDGCYLVRCVKDIVGDRRLCSSIDPLTPYCDAGACTSVPSDECPVTLTPPFDCTGSGTFPDPTNCTVAQTCTGVGDASPVPFQCPPGNAYNSKRKLCELRTTASCQSVTNCNRVTNNTFIPYLPNPAYYLYCQLSGTKTTLTIFQCPNVDTDIFDTSIRDCRYNCITTGFFAASTDTTKCNQYIQCSRSGNRWIATKLTCPDGSIFGTMDCVPGTCS